MLRRKQLAASAVLLVSLAASAESNRVCLGGNIEQLSATQVHACQQTAQQVHATADKSGARNWHFVVVCDEGGWQDYAAFAMVSADQLQAATTDTNVAERTTFVRASRVNTPEGSTSLAADMAFIARSGGVDVAALR